MILLAAALLLVSLAAAGLWRLRLSNERETVLNRQLSALLDKSESGVSFWDQSGRLIRFNDRFQDFYPSVTLSEGLGFEDLVRFTASRAVFLIGEAEMETGYANGSTVLVIRRNRFFVHQMVGGLMYALARQSVVRRC